MPDPLTTEPPVLDGPVPHELIAIAERHGQAVAAGDNAATLADFRPDRSGQLLGSARLPDDLVSSRLLRLQAEPDGLVAVFIRYTAADGSQTVLRSRWIKLDQGWRVTQVRNVPDTPPVIAAAGPRDDGLDRPHWEGLRAGEVRIQRCGPCGHWIWASLPAAGDRRLLGVLLDCDGASVHIGASVRGVINPAPAAVTCPGLRWRAG